MIEDQILIPGDRVRLSAEGRTRTLKNSPEETKFGFFVRYASRGTLVLIQRDGIKNPEVFGRSFWEIDPAAAPTAETEGE